MVTEILTALAAAITALRWRLFSTANANGIAPSDGLPWELVDAQLVYAETPFLSARAGVSARVDRAYRLNEQIVLVELKTRARDTVYLSDVIELSAQRRALADAKAEKVASHAWVIVHSTQTGRRRPHRVELMHEEQVDALRRRYLSARSGAVLRLKPAASVAQCQRCGHSSRCGARMQGQ
jgi:CRISPR-associated exonuclease Cas4